MAPNGRVFEKKINVRTFYPIVLVGSLQKAWINTSLTVMKLDSGPHLYSDKQPVHGWKFTGLPIDMAVCLYEDSNLYLILTSPLFVQLMHTNYYKIVKELKSFKILILALTCFRLLKPSSGGALSLCFAKVTMLTSVTYRYLKLSVLWLHMQPQYR